MVQNYIVFRCSTGNLSSFNGRGYAYRSVVGHRCSACLVGRQCFAVEIQHYVFAFGNIYRFGSVFKQNHGVADLCFAYCTLQTVVTCCAYSCNVIGLLAHNYRSCATFIRYNAAFRNVGSVDALAECSAGKEGRNFGVYLQRLATLFRRNTAVGNACRNFTVLHFSNAESHTAFINATFRRGFGCLVFARSDKFAAAYVYRSATNFYGDFSANNTARNVQRALFRREVDCRTVCMRYTAAYNVDCCSATHSACFVRLDCGEQPVGHQHCRCVDDGFAVGVHAVFTCSNREAVCKRYHAFGIGFLCKRRNADDIGVCIAFSNNGTVGNFHRCFAAAGNG